MRLILFDCDGTLVDSQGLIVAAMQGAFTAHGLAPPEAGEVHEIIGLSLPIAIRTLCEHHPEAPVADLTAAYSATYSDLVGDAAKAERPFAGILEVLDTLDAPDTLLGVVTGKSRRGLDRILAAHDLTHRFVVTKTADDAASKPAPDMVLDAVAETGGHRDRTVVIGDTTFDMEMARNAKVSALGVAWGYHATERLGAAGAMAVADAPSDLPALIDTLLPRA